MTISLGLDIGSNSVGSAWVDTDQKTIALGVSVFPAGVDETDTKRGAPVNQRRREKRSQRRSLARRAQRKRLLRQALTGAGLLPSDATHLTELFKTNPWALRRDALRRALTPHEFGRVLLHLGQRRGAVGIETDPEDKEEGKVKEAIDRLHRLMLERHAETFGQLMADLMDERRKPLAANGKTYQEPIRNRQYRMPESNQLYADRPLVRAEFAALWEKQKSFGGELAKLLTDELRLALDEPREDDTWRHKGVLFGQRCTYWDTGTLGRCDLEPTDQRCPLADMHAQEFRVVETVNNIRIEERDKPPRSLTPKERADVIAALRKQKTGSVATVRRALGIDKKAVKAFFTLNIERDPDREINTDWFYREIVHGVFTEDRWQQMDARQRESVNRALLRFDPDTPAHADALRQGAQRWWDLPLDAAERLISAWRARPKLEKRINLSRRAVLNLLPYMNEFDPVNNRWATQIEARQRFVDDGNHDAPLEQRRRYALDASALTKADRHYLAKHPDLLPPAPMLANPVVRKAIHEVRRHILSYVGRFGRQPDEIVIELARSAKQPEIVRNRQLAANRRREAERREIEEKLKAWGIPESNWNVAVRRVRLCREQNGVCPFSLEGANRNREITEKMAAEGREVEIEHIVPSSLSGPTMNFNNIVLCFREANRGKGQRTPVDWLGPEKLQLVLQRLEKTPVHDNRAKWENLMRPTPELEEFLNSQLTDTAYAARQVGQYLRSALYRDQADAAQRVRFTRGSYTAILRRDWQLVQAAGPKVRDDHRHHAIDAVAVALTDRGTIQNLAHRAAEQEEARSQQGYWPKRRPLPPPWGTVEEFRRQVFAAADQLVVSHRAVKRRITGAFHEETAYGPVVAPLPSHRREPADTLFTNRISAENLTPNHLRVPEKWDALSARLDEVSLMTAAKNDVRRQLAALVDPPPGKSGIVRDRALRDQFRRCLRRNGLDPDRFTKDEVKRLVRNGHLCMASGVPIKSVVLLRTNADPVIMPRKIWDDGRQRYVSDPDPRTRRVYIGGNNHHIEIRESLKTGKWSGEVVTTFEAARRLRIEKQAAVDRSDRQGQRFIMSLAEGETLRMRHPDTAEPGYFVVFKLDKPRTIHFIHHWDARPSQTRKHDDGKEIPNSKREDIAVTPGNLNALGVDANAPPYKVRVSPLGEVQRLDRD